MAELETILPEMIASYMKNMESQLDLEKIVTENHKWNSFREISQLFFMSKYKINNFQTPIILSG
jgi:ferritin